MIIEKWSKLEDNYLDSNFQFTTIKSEKIDFTTLLRKSVDNVTESNNLDNLLKVADNINHRFTKAYNKYPLIYKISSLFCKKIGIRATLPQYYDEFITKIISEIVKNSKSNPIDFLEKVVFYNPEKLRNPEGQLTILGKIFSKCFIKVVGNHEESTDLLQYDEFITKIVSQISEIFKNNLTGFIEKINSYDPQKLRNEEGQLTTLGEIFTKYLNVILEIQQGRTNIKGIFYEITNQFNCKSYLIGTIHILPKNSISSIPTPILEKIQQSDEFISEVGKETPGESIDKILLDIALKHRVKVTSLETMSFQENIVNRINSISNTEWYTSLSENKKNKLFSLQLLHNPMNRIIALQEAWQDGDIDTIKLLGTHLISPEEKNILFKERNKQWLTNTEINLLDKLQNAKKSISIVVGAGHLVGKTGLLKAFQNIETLQIQQII